METTDSSEMPLNPGVDQAVPVLMDWDSLHLHRVENYPRFRIMGSKHRLLPWIHSVLTEIPFETALDGFSGSGCVSYLLKAMGKEVTSNDFMQFSTTISRALVENSHRRITPSLLEELTEYDPRHRHFIERTFTDIFFEAEDLRFLDRVSWNLQKLDHRGEQDLALTALFLSCLKRQPRGVFTVAGDPEKYKDGRRDLRLSIREHFLEQVAILNEIPFDTGQHCRAVHGDIFDLEGDFDLVYLDPPYVPRSDDNCYMKRYHFLEGLSCYWQGQSIMQDTKVRKIEKPYTPFSYRREAVDTFARLFSKFRKSTIVLSYSSNGFPDLEILVDLLKNEKSEVRVYDRSHRYHFGTHKSVRRSRVDEYLLVGL